MVGDSVVKNLPASAGDPWFDPWVRKILWRRKWQPIPVVLPGESCGRRSLGDWSPWGCKRVRHNLATKQQQQNDKIYYVPDIVLSIFHSLTNVFCPQTISGMYSHCTDEETKTKRLPKDHKGSKARIWTHTWFQGIPSLIPRLYLPTWLDKGLCIVLSYFCVCGSFMSFFI